MIVTGTVVTEKLVNYLNHAISLADLVNWAENTFIEDVIEPESDVPILNDILMSLAAADTVQFPLTWEACTAFLEQLGSVAHVSVRQIGQ